ncbi:MAG: 3-isopropylmalate dehydratase small subunit [Emcibacter sp.]|nr:3-isopropylmalate dehydratase small subunit [Emcibacter sp.]
MSKYVFEGKSWKVGDFIPTDQIIKSRRVYQSIDKAAKYVFEDINPRFGQEVQKGDILVAGKHFGQSSGRAVAVKALIATGVSCIVAESFSRTFYRNAFEIGLPILEVSGVHDAVEEGDRISVDVLGGVFCNERTGEKLEGKPIDPFLIEMIEAGGVIAMAPKLVGRTT